MRYVYAFLFILYAAGLPAAESGPEESVLGKSVDGREIRALRFGRGPEAVVLYGGIHGGYEWNTVALAQSLVGFFEAEPEEVPAGVSLYIIPCLNPDGLAAVSKEGALKEGPPLDASDLKGVETSIGRFNARGVDLNRNWDARWEPTSQWRSVEVDAGSRPFSEPETRALRDFVLSLKPAVVVSFHSAANGIYYSGKRDQWEPARRMAQLYSEASGYPIPQGRGLVGYRITGASGGYFYEQGIPEITIELAGRKSPEFERNLAGVRALLSAAASDAADTDPPSAE